MKGAEKMTNSYRPPVKKATSAPTQKRRRSVSLERKKAWAGWVFVLPFVLGFLIIYAPLIVESIYTSLSVKKGFDDELRVIREFVGFQNYQKAFFEDAEFTKVLVTGLTELLFDIPAIVIFSLFMAVLLNQKMVGRAMFRAIFFVPVILCTGLINSIDSSTVANMEGGGIDTGSGSGGATEIVNSADLSILFENMAIGGELVEYVTGIINNIYDIINRSGVQMLIFLAGLQSISPAIYESCSIDGASAWETFWKITFPMIGPMILVNTVYTVIDAFTSSANTVMQFIAIQNNGPLATAMSWSYFTIVIVAIAAVCGLLSGFIFYQRRD